MMKQIVYSGAGKLENFALDKVEFGPSKSALERMAQYAGKNLTKIDEKIKARMKYLAMRIKSETLTEGDGGQPDPGDVVRFHFVLSTADGKVLADSRKKGKPSESRIAGKMPEGIAYALCSMNMGGKSRFRIPAAFAYGTQRDNMVFEVELLGYVRNEGDKPPIKSGLFGYELAPLDMKETIMTLPSGPSLQFLMILGLLLPASANGQGSQFLRPNSLNPLKFASPSAVLCVLALLWQMAFKRRRPHRIHAANVRR